MKRIITLLIIATALILSCWFWVPKAKGAESDNLADSLADIQAKLNALRVQVQALQLQSSLAPGEQVIATSTVPGYFRVVDSCNWAQQGSCVNVRTGPGVSYRRALWYFEAGGPQPARVRNGQMFYVTDLVKGADGRMWLKIGIDRKSLVFPDRIRGDWYVAADYFEPVWFLRITPERDAVKSVKIVLREQKLYAYEGDKVVMSVKVSTGRDDIEMPTPTGHFHIFAKYPVRVMEGPLKGLTDEYTLFVPFSMAFYRGNLGTAYIHAAYWHNSFGSARSHGCVNLTFDDAEWLYNWTPDPAAREIPVTIVP
jgi:hypothetical protein